MASIGGTLSDVVAKSVKDISIYTLREVNTYILEPLFRNPSDSVIKPAINILKHGAKDAQQGIEITLPSLIVDDTIQSPPKTIFDGIYALGRLIRPYLSYIAQRASDKIYNITQYESYPTDNELMSSLSTFIITIMCIILITSLVWKIISMALGLDYKGTGVNILDVTTFDTTNRPDLALSDQDWRFRATDWFRLHTDDIDFLSTIFDRSGIGPVTHFSRGITQWPPCLDMKSARDEAQMVQYEVIDKILADNNVTAQDIDILVVNCSLYNPTPSSCAMIVNHYNMRPDVQCYNFGGMGCGASPIAINAASMLLRSHPKKHALALVLSMENLSQNIYFGRERAAMLSNALFRVGGAAILLTLDNKAVLGRPAPLATIEHLSHLHTAANVDAYSCVFQDIDKELKQGIRLDKSLMSVAAAAITRNLTTLAPKFLPLSAKLDYVARMLVQKLDTLPIVQKWTGRTLTLPGQKNPDGTPMAHPRAAEITTERASAIVPNFRLAIQHFCIHAGGRAVLDAVQKALKLTDADMRPARDVLYIQGNTSSSSVWYELQQVRQTRQPKVGDRVLQIAVGSGFKCNIMVVKMLKRTPPRIIVHKYA